MTSPAKDLGTPRPYTQWNSTIADRYGRKQAWISHIFYLLLQHLGAYRNYQRIDWKRVTRLIFVCKGNICRSAYGEARARALGFNTTSFGLGVEDQTGADATSIKVGSQRGLDLSPHRTKSRSQISLSGGDLLIAMEPWQAAELKLFSNHTNAQVTLLGLWHGKPRPYIGDPYGLSPVYFNTCFAVIDQALDNLIRRINGSYAQ
jgi:protein-tyrosine phosphatase